MNTSAGTSQGPNPPFRVGVGYDLHRLEPVAPAGQGKPLVIGGVTVESDVGPVAHSDGDALAHAITDALLGAAALPDIGQLFPNTDNANRDRDSRDFLRAAAAAVAERGWAISNIDAVVVTEAAKIGPRKPAIVAALAETLAIEPARVGLKGKSGEGVDAAGRREAIVAHAIVLLMNDG